MNNIITISYKGKMLYSFTENSSILNRLLLELASNDQIDENLIEITTKNNDIN